MESRACMSCEKELPISMYDCSGTKNDKIYYRSKCKSCRLDDKHRRDENKKNAEKVVITIKQCDICNSTKNCDEFSRESKSIDGYQSCCKSCYKIIRWRNKDKASIISTLEEKLCSTCNIVKNIALFKSNKK